MASDPTPRFYGFQNLPFELRAMLWQFAIRPERSWAHFLRTFKDPRPTLPGHAIIVHDSNGKDERTPQDSLIRPPGARDFGPFRLPLILRVFRPFRRPAFGDRRR